MVWKGSPGKELNELVVGLLHGIAYEAPQVLLINDLATLDMVGVKLVVGLLHGIAYEAPQVLLINDLATLDMVGVKLVVGLLHGIAYEAPQVLLINDLATLDMVRDVMVNEKAKYSVTCMWRHQF